jgi:hypothetical protein
MKNVFESARVGDEYATHRQSSIFHGIILCTSRLCIAHDSTAAYIYYFEGVVYFIIIYYKYILQSLFH